MSLNFNVAVWQPLSSASIALSVSQASSLHSLTLAHVPLLVDSLTMKHPRVPVVNLCFYFFEMLHLPFLLWYPLPASACF